MKKNKFSAESISSRMKLAQLDNDKGVLAKYDDWGDFHRIYDQNYSA